MSNNIDQENPPANDDNTDATNDRGENNYFRPHLAKYEVSSHIAD